MCFKLSECAIGEDIEIVKIEDGDIASKMIEMGLTEKLITKVVLIAPLGDPIAIDINGFIVSSNIVIPISEVICCIPFKLTSFIINVNSL